MFFRHSFISGICVLGLVVFSMEAAAAKFPIPGNDTGVIGEISTVRATYDDTLLDIARRNGVGYQQIKMSNPGVDVWLPGEGQVVTIPRRFLLPHARREGIVLNIPEMRLYYYPQRSSGQATEVYSFPLGIGREGWSTPYIKTSVIRKHKDPYWHPPESIKKEHAEKGDPLPDRVAPGPDNPLGKYALRLGLPQYLIHGTNKPSGVGMRVSHGCIRLYPEDIELLYSMVNTGTPVNIINQPYKVGLHNNEIFLEAHPYLDEDTPLFRDNLTSVVSILIDITGDRRYEVDWDLAKQVIRELDGNPVRIGRVFDETRTQVSLVPAGEPVIGTEFELRLDMNLSAGKK